MVERYTMRDVGLAMLIGLLASLPAAPGPRSTDNPVAFESETGRAHVLRVEQDMSASATVAEAAEPDRGRS